jgi:methyl-accepting chemotaxis protein
LKIFSKLSFSARLLALVTMILVMASAALTVIFVWRDISEIHTAAEEQLRSALAVLEMEHVDGGEKLYVSLNQVRAEEFHQATNVHLSVLVPEYGTAGLRREITTLHDEQGHSLVGTRLSVSSDAYAAVMAGRRFHGHVELYDQLYLAVYDPILNPDGKLGSVVFVAVTLDGVQAAYWSAATHVQRVARPITAVTRAVDRLAANDYVSELPEVTSQDEIGRMIEAVATLRARLLEAERLAHLAAEAEVARARQSASQKRVVTDLEQALKALAGGDLGAPIPNPAQDPFPGEYEALRQSYNATIARIAGVMGNVLAIARGVRDGAHEISQASRNLSSRAEAQAATLEQSAAALNELTASVGSTAARAAEAQQASVASSRGALDGVEVARRAMAAMQGIERSSDQITQIIGVIDDIAFQTNLLALNAGVEAARAGDAGRGFAVVASEVRVLARRASESAKEIKALIFESSQQVKAGSALVGQAGQSLDAIVERAKEAAGLVADIAVAATEQANGISELNSGIGQLDQTTQQNSAMAEQTDAAGASLLDRAEDLMQALAGFRLGAEAAAEAAALAREPAGRGAAVAPLVSLEPRVVDWVPAAREAAASRQRSPAEASWREF